MITFETDCPDCNETVKRVQAETLSFLFKLVKDLKATDELDHFNATTLMLMVMGTVGAMLDESLNNDVALIALSTAPESDKRDEIELLVSSTIKTCFDIMSESLPIDMTTEQVAKKDMSTVIDFATALKVRKGTIQ